MKTLKRNPKNPGSALLNAVILCSVLAIAVSGIVGVARNIANNEVASLEEVRAYLAAEAGLQVLTGWVAGAVAESGVNVLQVSNTPSTIEFSDIPVALAIRDDPKGRNNHWLLEAQAVLPDAPYKTTVTWVVEVGADPNQSPWDNNVVYANGDLIWHSNWDQAGGFVVHGNFDYRGGAGGFGDNVWVGKNFTTATDNLTFKKDSWIGGNFHSNGLRNRGDMWVGGTLSGGINENSGNINYGDLGNTWSSTYPPPDYAKSDIPQSRESPVRPIINTGSILGEASGATAVAWDPAWSQDGNGQAMSAALAAIPNEDKYRDADGNYHVIIRIDSEVNTGFSDGVTLPANVIFMVEGNGARLSGHLPSAAATDPHSVMVYVDQHGRLGEGEWLPKLSIPGNFNGLVYVDPANTRTQFLEFSSSAGSINGAIYLGEGTTHISGNAGSFTFNEAFMNRYSNFIIPDPNATPKQGVIVRRCEFRTRFVSN